MLKKYAYIFSEIVNINTPLDLVKEYITTAESIIECRRNLNLLT